MMKNFIERFMEKKHFLRSSEAKKRVEESPAYADGKSF